MAAAFNEALARQSATEETVRGIVMTSRVLNTRACAFYERKMGGTWLGEYGDGIVIPQGKGREPRVSARYIRICPT
jgi:hypothetical protein